MSNAWETTTDDVQTVLEAHGVSLSYEQLEEIHGSLDHEDIQSGVLYFVTMEVQTQSMLSDIEDHLMREGIIQGEKKFVINEDEDFDPEGEDDDDEDI